MSKPTMAPNELAPAVSAGDLARVRQLLIDGVDRNIAEEGIPTPLYYAVESKRIDLVVTLLEAGADPDLGFQAQGITPLMRAITLADPVIAELLLDHGADPNLAPDQLTPLSAAVAFDSPECIQLLARRRVDLDQKVGDKSTALTLAATKPATAVLTTLLDAGARIDESNENGQTALWHAACYGSTACVDLLIERGASLDITDRWGRSALFTASENGHVDAVTALLQAGARLDLPDLLDRTPLMSAATKLHADVVRCLLAHGANPHWVSKNGQTAYSLAFAATPDPDDELLDALWGTGVPIRTVFVQLFRHLRYRLGRALVLSWSHLRRPAPEPLKRLDGR